MAEHRPDNTVSKVVQEEELTQREDLILTRVLKVTMAILLQKNIAQVTITTIVLQQETPVQILEAIAQALIERQQECPLEDVLAAVDVLLVADLAEDDNN